MVMLPEKKISHVKGFFDGINDIILRIVDLIMISGSLWSICFLWISCRFLDT